ncbi:aldehyde dehydrogenase [Clostridium botulinum]|uniref:Aldehyde dehydrogenase n=1 Tax=Clostridium botulinum (strain Hall / ATCC 3502 / NCTC 13319 / Type A) TaxID=441771 RepID=A5I0U1_CLOBH|nr:aldehyde dehydrogenase [Clostridium botulinum]ABS33306.1 aldehyde dehydrogenase family protein [Clostridium botulinum A str. ATCC 19397]ABS38645.1 aldehyde dehydrogenase family protein [Clostridium botulinum A str. Hall]APQ95761.1 acyl-CoA reductase family protein [Clostridium botulinum]AWB17020.1 aldehyde dehydrogenase [Clostridium botulinum]AWB29816.1 aldehyde dehydrogenase [Clostridium botulinum]
MENIRNILEKQKSFFDKGYTKDINFRIEALKKLKHNIKINENNIFKALKIDLNKSEFETFITEIGIVYDEINGAIKNIKKWSKPKKVKTPITNFLASSYIYNEPYGVALIMSPWNYPFQLIMAPLVGAISAGNCVLLKPSELAIETEKIIVKIIKDTFSDEYIGVITGGIEESTALLKEKFDYIFYTGGINVGKIVMRAAAEHLTPITLELGGKSPCIVDKDANIDLAARRIAWGKFLNAGQTCVAPDYLVVHRNIKEKLISSIENYIIEFFGENTFESEDYPRIINERHFKRLEGYLKEGKIVSGGNTDINNLYIEPTIIEGINFENRIMEEEIFGPVFPVIEFENIDKVIEIVKNNPKPLALYYFSENKEKQEFIIKNISFGGGCINDTIMHLSTSTLPFGGVGNSGIGGYHGRASFDTFSHKKSILKKSNLIDVKIRYAPFKGKINLAKRLFK